MGGVMRRLFRDGFFMIAIVVLLAALAGLLYVVAIVFSNTQKP